MVPHLWFFLYKILLPSVHVYYYYSDLIINHLSNIKAMSCRVVSYVKYELNGHRHEMIVPMYTDSNTSFYFTKDL